MNNDPYDIISNPDNWPTIAPTVGGGEYLVEQLATLLTWAQQQAAQYGTASDLTELPAAHQGPCFDCTHDHHPDNHHYERFTIGPNHFCRTHTATHIRARTLTKQPLRTPPLTYTTGSYPTQIPKRWEQEQQIRAAEQHTETKAA